MKAYSIDPKSQQLKTIDIELEANTVYSFFSSILIDESFNIDKHVVYADGNAIAEGKKPFFLGSQLVVGDLLILGREGFEDTFATIPSNELELLIDYDLNNFYTQTLALLKKSDVNLYRTFEVDKAGEKIELNTEWVLYTFNIADDRTKEYFLNELQNALSKEESGMSFMQKMAGLAIKAMG